MKRTDPGYLDYMRTIARKGGYATHNKHPGHLAQIAHMGGDAIKGQPRHRKSKPEPQQPVIVQQSNTLALDVLDSILADLG